MELTSVAGGFLRATPFKLKNGQSRRAVSHTRVTQEAYLSKQGASEMAEWKKEEY